MVRELGVSVNVFVGVDERSALARDRGRQGLRLQQRRKKQRAAEGGENLHCAVLPSAPQAPSTLSSTGTLLRVACE